MRSPKDWQQHVDQLKTRAKDVVRTCLPVTQLSLLRSRVLQPSKLPKRKCVRSPQTRTATYEQAEDVYLKTLVLLTPLLTKPMAKPIEAWRQFHEKATAWIIERRDRLEDEGYERVLDYSEFPMMDSLLPVEPLWLVEAKPAMKLLCAVPFRDKTITELDVSGQSIGVEGALVIHRYLENNEALTSLNISSNKIGLMVPPAGWRSKDGDGVAPWVHDDGRTLESGVPEGSKPEGAIAIANAICTNMALAKLIMRKNGLLTKEAGKALGNMLAAKTALKEFDISDNYGSTAGSVEDIPGFTKEFAVGLSANGPMTSLNISANKLRSPSAKALAGALRDNSVLKQLNVAENQLSCHEKDGKGLDMSGIVEFTDAIKNNGVLTSLNISSNNLGELVFVEDGWSETGDEYKGTKEYNHTDGRKQKNKPPQEPKGAMALSNAVKNNGALENLHIGNNNIPVENMNDIIAQIEAAPAMKVLCAVPFRDKTITELDVSGQSLGVEGAVVIGRYLENNRALVKLDISNNEIRVAGAKALAAALNHNNVLSELNVALNAMTNPGDGSTDMSGVIAIRDVIPTMRALESLNGLNA